MQKILLILCCNLCLVGCASRAGTGALTGCSIGTLSGVVIGGSAGGRYPELDAGVYGLACGAIGTAVGALIGYAVDGQVGKEKGQSNAREIQRMYRSNCLTVNDELRFSQEELTDETMKH